MTTYYLRAKAKSPAHNVVFKSGKTFDRIEEFFVAGGDPPGAAFLPPLVGELQYGVKASMLPRLDYLPSFGGVPLFSEAFVQAMSDKLKGEAEFHPCTVLCEQRPFAYFVARLLRKRRLLDYPASGLGEGSAQFQANYLRVDLNEDFLIAREENKRKCYVFVASDAFRTTVEKHRLGVGFTPALVTRGERNEATNA